MTQMQVAPGGSQKLGRINQLYFYLKELKAKLEGWFMKTEIYYSEPHDTFTLKLGDSVLLFANHERRTLKIAFIHNATNNRSITVAAHLPEELALRFLEFCSASNAYDEAGAVTYVAPDDNFCQQYAFYLADTDRTLNK